MSDPKPLLEVAIEGEGLSPRDVPVRQAVELLAAAMSAVEAVAAERGLEPPDMRLTTVRLGSAAYDLDSDSPTGEEVVRCLYDIAKARGVASGHATRRALARLHDAGKQLGSVRLTPGRVTRGKRPKPLHVAPPIEDQTVTLERADEVYGRIVGLSVRGLGTYVRLKLDSGRSEEFQVAEDLEKVCARFFNQTARARVTYDVRAGYENPGVLEAIAAWSGDDVFSAIRSIRDQLLADGEEIDVDAWLREVEE